MEINNFLKLPEAKKLPRVIVTLPAGIFLAEVAAMLLVQFYEGHYAITILLDAIITTTLMLPVIYILSYQPLLKHIAEQERVESIMQVRLRLMQFAVEHTVDELLQTTLDEIETLTGSTVSFFHSVKADQNIILLQAWSTNTLKNMCTAEGKDSHYDVDEAGVWADCIRQRKPVIHNDYVSLAHRKGLPEGHAPIVREMVIPILRDGQIVATLGVGNKPQDFTENDVELVSTFADFAWDIIERKQAEDALRESEQKFRTLVDWTYDCEQWVDPQGKIVYISPSCERITGYHPEDFISDSDLLAQIVHPDDRNFYREHHQLVHDETASISSVEYRIVGRDGSVRWIEHNCRPLFGEDNRYLGRRVSNRDITGRKLAEKEIMERNQKENMLTEVIHTMQLEIARDLHDTVGQNIGFLRMRLDHLSEADKQAHLDLNAEITNMLKVANESYDLIRGTLTVLQSGGLADPLKLFIQYANQVEERSPFKIDVSSQGEPRPLAPNQVRQLFYVFREALSNIEKHANASQVSVELIWDDVNLALMIADNGRGFRLDDTQVRNHYGLKFMRERIESLNGIFSVQTKEGQGTRIKITLPYEKR
jgi:PAS domain S-box-containing protein